MADNLCNPSDEKPALINQFCSLACVPARCWSRPVLACNLSPLSPDMVLSQRRRGYTQTVTACHDGGEVTRLGIASAAHSDKSANKSQTLRSLPGQLLYNQHCYLAAVFTQKALKCLLFTDLPSTKQRTACTMIHSQ